MKQRHNPNITQMFKGFRMTRKKIENKMESVPLMPKLTLNKNLLKKLEKVEILTQLQHDIVAEQLEKCTEKSYPIYIARLDALLRKAVS